MTPVLRDIVLYLLHRLLPIASRTEPIAPKGVGDK